MDYKFLTAIYASIISTIVFVWRLYEFYYDKTGRLKVNLKSVSRANVFVGGKMGELELFLVTTIVNIGKNKRHIEEPQFISNSKQKGKKHFNILNFNKKINYPISLEPGEKHEYSVPFKDLDKDFKEKGISKIRTIVFDTHRKQYRSKWFNI